MAELLPTFLIMSPSSYSALVVDDDVDLCQLMVRILATNKIRAAIAHTLAEAEQCLKMIKPKLILLDNNLPDGQGIDFMKTIKAFDKQIRVIMITGDTAGDIRERASEEGIDIFLEKPFSFESLRRKAKNVVRENLN